MQKAPHILICDDQPIIHESLGIYLEREGFTHESAFDGVQALKKARENPPSLILLDLMMPGISGTEVCRELRKTSQVPIIMLTAKSEEVDRILGLEFGADDYIVKPFSAREVVARVKAVLRRTEQKQVQPLQILRFEGLEINAASYDVRVDGKSVPLTPKEVEILYLLASQPGRVFDREQILAKVWGYDYFGDTRAVDTQIKRIRQKLPQDSVDWGVKTVYGIGYKFETGK
ncbi:MAG TPA: response regulator transcription factor [Clostridia bacterium]|nr:MAG: Transcriptional regulatory protein SrrA [Firmicutes bacterium ADurb.Bin356]HOF94549.1 response regulator transcription factor [Clostridia bacterium]